MLAVRPGAGEIEVCLIRRRDSGKWGIPKGLIDPGDTPEEAALKEAWEEAGITGSLVGPPIGTYVYEKWGASITVVVYVMRVVDEQPSWPEMRFRERRWTPASQAMSLLARHPVRPLVDGLGARLQSGPV